MKNYYKITLLFLTVVVLSCGSPTPQETPITQTSTSEEVEKNSSKITEKDIKTEEKINADRKIEDKKLLNTEVLTEENQIQNILNNPNIQVDFAPEDNTVIEENETLIFGQEKMNLAYKTTCLNDQNVLQEFFIFDEKDPKNTYLISHNYQTEILLQNEAGQIILQKIIKKEFFRDFVDKTFLQKSIIKHPEFMGYDEKKQEATFSFLLGIPSTDLIALATVKINTLGQLKVIKVENVSL